MNPATLERLPGGLTVYRRKWGPLAQRLNCLELAHKPARTDVRQRRGGVNPLEKQVKAAGTHLMQGRDTVVRRSG
jgi:hypothetical protein